jgi:hypothetical protein
MTSLKGTRELVSNVALSRLGFDNVIDKLTSHIGFLHL